MASHYEVTLQNWVEVYKQRFNNIIEYNKEMGDNTQWHYDETDLGGLGIIRYISN
jgi:hypothetical protein